jgi:hypothetical protein
LAWAPAHDGMATFSEFITREIDSIVDDREAFARTTDRRTST